MTLPRMLAGLSLLLAALALMVLLAWSFQRHLIYFPFPRPIPPAASIIAHAEEVSFTSADGVSLAAWFVPARGPRVVTVLVFHGNGGDRSLRAPLAEALARHGLSVLLFDYRGYGGNRGTPTEAGLLRDARAARAYLASRADVDSQRVAYFGESLGAAVAVSLAAEQRPLALVLRSPFTSLADIGRFHYPFLPVELLLRDRYASIDRIRRVACPVLVVAGDRDRTIPASFSRRLYGAAPEPKRLVMVRGADHNDWELLAGEELVGATVDFVGAALARTAAP